MDAAGAASPHGMDRPRRGGLQGLLLRVSGGADDPAATELLGELEREVALLREENARLKLARERAAERPVNERVRAAFTLPDTDEEAEGEDPWEVLTEGMLLRDALIDACRELEQGAHELRVRLETLLPAAEAADLRPSDNFEGVA